MARWVLLRGGVITGGGMSLAVYGLLLLARYRHGIRIDTIAPLVPVLCMPAGMLWGLLTWHWNSFLYRKLGFKENDRP